MPFSLYLNWCGLPKLHLVDLFQHALEKCVGKLKAKVKPWTVEICGIKDFQTFHVPTYTFLLNVLLLVVRMDTLNIFRKAPKPSQGKGRL